ncbi:hypothetical protein SEEHN189_06005, partial [Salmonella enterica subsp. enterica serovar Heidelberg str. N189]
TASWTDDELARRLPEGRAQRVNPPLTAIFKKELVRMYGLFLHNDPSIAGWRHSSQAPYPVYISAAPPGNNTTIRLPYFSQEFQCSFTLRPSFEESVAASAVAMAFVAASPVSNL